MDNISVVLFCCVLRIDRTPPLRYRGYLGLMDMVMQITKNV